MHQEIPVQPAERRRPNRLEPHAPDVRVDVVRHEIPVRRQGRGLDLHSVGVQPVAEVLRDGVMKRGSTWSFVIRVTDERTGVSKPKWAGGFATEAAAKEARDSARVAARQGVYVDRSRITVTQYLGNWLDAHAMEIKPATLSTYRYLVTHYVNPHIGRMRLQAVRPTTLSGLYRDLLVCMAGRKGGRCHGQPW